jgi:hypothetical protein
MLCFFSFFNGSSFLALKHKKKGEDNQCFCISGPERENLVFDPAGWEASPEKKLFFWGFLLTLIKNLGL